MTTNGNNRTRKPEQTPHIEDGREVIADEPAPRLADRTPEHAEAADSRFNATHEGDDHEEAREAPRVRMRRRKATVFDDPFYIPLNEIPPELSYEWKRVSNVGEENPFYIAQMREQGWEPVPPKRHPTWVPPGYDKPHIIKGGLMLMDRPKELTQEARDEQRQLAMRQVREAEQRLGKTATGEMTRDFPGVRPNIQKEIMRPIMAEE